MPINPLDPGFVKLKYARGGIEHVAVYQIAFNGVPSVGFEPNFATQEEDVVDMSTALNAWVSIIRPAYEDTVTFVSGECWRKTSPTADPIWIYTENLAIAGNSANPTIVAGQLCQTFRTQEGGLLKIFLMESSAPANIVTNPPYTAATLEANISNYLRGGTSWIRGRDDSFAIADIRVTTKINDSLRKQLIL